MRPLIVSKLLTFLGNMTPQELGEFIGILSDEEARATLLRLLSEINILGKPQLTQNLRHITAGEHSKAGNVDSKQAANLEIAIGEQLEEIFSDKSRFRTAADIVAAVNDSFGDVLLSPPQPKDGRGRVIARVVTAIKKLSPKEVDLGLKILFKKYVPQGRDGYDNLFKILSRE